MTGSDGATHGPGPAGDRQWSGLWGGAAGMRQRAILAAGAAAAVALTAATAVDVRLGVAALAALALLPLALSDVAFGIAAVAALAFLARLPVVGVAPTALLLVVALRWWAVRRRSTTANGPAVPGQRALAAAVVGLVLWCGLSLAWAQRSDPGQAKLADWAVAAALCGIVATSVVKPRHVRAVLYAFVGGAVVSVLIGLAARRWLPDSALAAQTRFDSRLQGGAGDPNFLAAGLVAAAALACGLLVVSRRRSERRALAAALAVLLVGLGATESRGGMVAAAVTALLAVVLARGARVRAALAVAAVAGLVVAALALSPGGLHRATASDAQGDGRAELWRVAARMIEERPLLGVGLANYRVRSGEFVRMPGSLRFVDLIAARPHEVHNTYLQLAAEAGLPGVLAFVLVAGLALRSVWRAERRFAARGESDLAAIARALLLAMVGMLAALVFITDGEDLRLWLLFGLAAALRRMAAGPAVRAD
jgi:O-antigen ligase